MTTERKERADRGAFWLICGVRVVAGLVVIFAYLGGDRHRDASACTPRSAPTPKYSYERDTPEESALAIRQPTVCQSRSAAAVVWR
ncbi:MAG TPA: hypothetical protein VER04_01470 [Polyangiaceae bacterium]|nr:hypothetical protein [Polyangiaceae bacterium]